MKSLDSERLIIQPAEPRDVRLIVDLWNNPAIMQQVGFPNGLSVTTDDILPKLQKPSNKLLERILAIRLKDQDTTIGHAMMHEPDEKGISETDIKLLPEFQGQRFGIEVKTVLIKHLFALNNCKAVQASPNLVNEASIRMQETTGGIRLGMGRCQFPEGWKIRTKPLNYWLYRHYREPAPYTDVRKRRFNYVAIVPAAGRSSRMKKFKPLLPWPPGKKTAFTVIESTLNSLLLAGCQRLCIAVDYRSSEIEKTLHDWPLTLISKGNCSEPMSSSVRASVSTFLNTLANNEETDTAYVLLPGDHPHVSPDTIRSLIEHHEKSPGCIHIPVHAGRNGHPAIFPPETLESLLKPDSKLGLRALMDGSRVPVVRHGVKDAGVLKNLDYPEDYS